MRKRKDDTTGASLTIATAIGIFLAPLGVLLGYFA